MPQQGRFASHIGSGEDYYLLRIVAENKVVGHILLAIGHQGLYHGVAPPADFYFQRVVHHRAGVAPLACGLGKRGEAVQTAHRSGVLLDGGDVALQFGHQVGINAPLDGHNLLPGHHNLLFVLLEFGGYVALGPHQCLLADPVGGDKLPVGIAHLQIVAEHVVIADFERGDAGAFLFPLLDFQQDTLAVLQNVAVVVEGGVHP